jgi:hypothetical protein
MRLRKQKEEELTKRAPRLGNAQLRSSIFFSAASPFVTHLQMLWNAGGIAKKTVINYH